MSNNKLGENEQALLSKLNSASAATFQGLFVASPAPVGQASQDDSHAGSLIHFTKKAKRPYMLLQVPADLKKHVCDVYNNISEDQLVNSVGKSWALATFADTAEVQKLYDASGVPLQGRHLMALEVQVMDLEPWTPESADHPQYGKLLYSMPIKVVKVLGARADQGILGSGKGSRTASTTPRARVTKQQGSAVEVGAAVTAPVASTF